MASGVRGASAVGRGGATVIRRLLVRVGLPVLLLAAVTALSWSRCDGGDRATHWRGLDSGYNSEGAE